MEYFDWTPAGGGGKGGEFLPMSHEKDDMSDEERAGCGASSLPPTGDLSRYLLLFVPHVDGARPVKVEGVEHLPGAPPSPLIRRRFPHADFGAGGGGSCAPRFLREFRLPCIGLGGVEGGGNVLGVQAAAFLFDVEFWKTAARGEISHQSLEYAVQANCTVQFPSKLTEAYLQTQPGRKTTEGAILLGRRSVDKASLLQRTSLSPSAQTDPNLFGTCIAIPVWVVSLPPSLVEGFR